MLPRALFILAFATTATHALPGQSSVMVPAGAFAEDQIGVIRIEYLYQQQTPNHAFGDATSRVGFAISNTASFATIPAPVSIAALSLVLFACSRRRDR